MGMGIKETLKYVATFASGIITTIGIQAGYKIYRKKKREEFENYVKVVESTVENIVDRKLKEYLKVRK